MSDYAKWAVELVRYFFGLQHANQRVRLMVTGDVLDQEFAALGGKRGFLVAVQAGPHFISRNSGTLLSRGKELYHIWATPDLRLPSYPDALVDLDNAPPFIPYLCLLCLAWTEDNDHIPAHAYYQRLSMLYPDHGLKTHLMEWELLWIELGRWTKTIDRKRGIFEVEQLGGMHYVGIPRSQVILTPPRIHRLPELFHNCGFEPEISVEGDRLRQRILSQGAISHQILGLTLMNEISLNKDLGRSAIKLISEHLESWSGELPEKETVNIQNGLRNGSTESILLALQPFRSSDNWERIAFAAERDRRLERVLFPHKDWKFKMASETLGILSHRDGMAVDAVSMLDRWSTGLNLNGSDELQAEELTDRSFRFSGKQFRLFDHWVDQWLIECKNLPQTGPVYVLFDSTLLKVWGIWLGFDDTSLKISDCSGCGLPSNYRLFCIEDVSAITLKMRREFPGAAGQISAMERAMKLIGGTRCNSSTARRIYTEYDPPLLVIQAPLEAKLVIVGAKETQLDGLCSPTSFLGNIVRSYSLEIAPNQAVVTARLEISGRMIGNATFGVYRGSQDSKLSSSDLILDRFGAMGNREGVSGMIVPRGLSRWSYTDGPHEKGIAFDPSVLDSPAFRFIEALHLHSSRFPFADYKRRACRIGGIESWRTSEQTRWLSELGFIDLLTDEKGRWSHVYPLPLQIYPLPWKAQGLFQFVMVGTGSIERIKTIIRAAQELLNIEVQIRPERQGHIQGIVPPRVTFLHSELAAGQQLAGEFGLKWSGQPPANQISLWAGDLNDWLAPIRWYPDEGPKPHEEYDPRQFRFKESVFGAPWHLRRFIDPFTDQRWHCLYRPANWEHGKQHAFVRDFSWAKWRVHMIVPEDDDITNLAYHPATGRLFIPFQLNFPYLLGRALAACSGSQPSFVFNCPFYVDMRHGVRLANAEAYHGQCFVYPSVPREIGEVVAKKVSARLVDVILE